MLQAWFEIQAAWLKKKANWGFKTALPSSAHHRYVVYFVLSQVKLIKYKRVLFLRKSNITECEGQVDSGLLKEKEIQKGEKKMLYRTGKKKL